MNISYNFFDEYLQKSKASVPCVKTKSGLTLHDFELTTTCDGPHDAVADRTSCSVRPCAILSAVILTIGGYRRPS